MTKDEVLLRLAAQLAQAGDKSAEAVRHLSATEGTPGEDAARKALDAATDAEERIIREMAHVDAEGTHGLAVKAGEFSPPLPIGTSSRGPTPQNGNVCGGRPRHGPGPEGGGDFAPPSRGRPGA